MRIGGQKFLDKSVEPKMAEFQVSVELDILSGSLHFFHTTPHFTILEIRF